LTSNSLIDSGVTGSGAGDIILTNREPWEGKEKGRGLIFWCGSKKNTAASRAAPEMEY